MSGRCGQSRFLPLRLRGFRKRLGRQLIDDIWTFAANNDEDCTYMHKWSAGDLLIWDNLMLQHARLPFDFE